MSVAADALHTRVKISDPRPAHCSACMQGASEGIRFIDFDAAYDNPTIVDDQQSIVWGSDDLHLCETCVRAAAEMLAFKATLHSQQSREIKRLEKEAVAWREYAEQLENLMPTRPEPTIQAPHEA